MKTSKDCKCFHAVRQIWDTHEQHCVEVVDIEEMKEREIKAAIRMINEKYEKDTA